MNTAPVTVQFYSTQRSCGCAGGGGLAALRACARPGQRGIGLQINVDFPSDEREIRRFPWRYPSQRDRYSHEWDRRNEALRRALDAAALVFWKRPPRKPYRFATRTIRGHRSGYMQLIAGAGSVATVARARRAREAAVESLRKDRLSVCVVTDEGGREYLPAKKRASK